MKHSIGRAAVVAVTAALALTACTGDDKATFDQGGAPQQSTQAAAGGDAEGDTAAESAAAAGVDLTAVGKPIATATVPAVVEGDPDATMTVSIYSLKRDGKTLTGTFSFIVNSDSASDEANSLYEYLGGTPWEPYLVDTANLARHDVLGDFPHEALTEQIKTSFRPEQTFFAYAAFAAPAADITSMTVSLVDGAPPATNLAIQ